MKGYTLKFTFITKTKICTFIYRIFKNMIKDDKEWKLTLNTLINHSDKIL